MFLEVILSEVWHAGTPATTAAVVSLSRAAGASSPRAAQALRFPDLSHSALEFARTAGARK